MEIWAERFSGNDVLENSLVCECEEVSVGEVKYALNELEVHNLVDLRRRTRVGMGTCQGELCACRAAGLMSSMHKYCTKRAKEDLASFLNERWKGWRLSPGGILCGKVSIQPGFMKVCAV